MSEKKKTSKKDKFKRFCVRVSKTSLWVGLGIVILIVVCLGVGIGYEQYYKNKVYPRVYLGSEEVSGLGFMEVLDKVEALSEQVDKEGLQFIYKEDKLTVEPVDISLENWEQPEVVEEIVTFQDQELTEEIYNLGRGDNWWQNLQTKVRLLFSGEHKYTHYTLRQDNLIEALQNYYQAYEAPAVDAQLSFEQGRAVVSQEESGKRLDYQAAVKQVEENLNSFSNQAVELSLVNDEPELTKEEAEKLLPAVEEVLDLAPLKLTYQDQSYEVTKEELQEWLKFDDQGLSLDQEKVEGKLEILGEEVNVPVQEGKFSLDQQGEEIVLTQFQESQAGLEIKTEESLTQIKEDLLNNKKSIIALVVDTAEPTVTPANAQEEIKELLGTGQTNFSGSPQNRRLNIAKAADILNGLLIPPGETFSLIKALGEIDGEHGWYQELVIKGNETKPEYGGGLCQIGTTTFRAAMMTGLEIVERANHSYAVSYYNYNGKPGVDATIYDPKPDMRFKNDTGHYLLWRVRIEGNDLYFEFWGTSDGRNGYFTEPNNYDYKSPPPTIETETEDLAPGQRKCTENAHTGLTADFDYVIDWPDGTQTVENFRSVYKPWPAVCLVGKSEDSEEKTEEDTTEVDGDDEGVEEEVKEDDSKKDTEENKTKKKKEKN